ncbi:hypothetical protein FRC02_010468 [Tulasnella sp. 418]|nr:hypothetical protein FRC02_010468 [Tulasnella sp. 418]
MSNESFYIGIDVGTGSARAALVASSGRVVASSTHDIKTFRSPTDAAIFEQSTDNIWAQIASCIKEVIQESGISPQQIKGLGFDATCSLAVTNLTGVPISVSESEGIGKVGERNIILWADHRAEAEAALINETGSEVLEYVGGTMSLEMEIPKILWLKRHMPADKFASCQFFDLPDYLTYKATGFTTRSNCSLVCKTSFVPPGVTKTSSGFDPSFLRQIGLEEFAHDASRIGGSTSNNDAGSGMVLTAGLPIGKGLSAEAANALGLVEGTPVGSGVIDAYAGWIGTVAARYQISQGAELSSHPSIEESLHRLAAVAGTSTCHLIQSKEGIFVPGVWGPYKNAVFPGWWMNEGGQSSTGQLIDFILTTHPAYPELQVLAKEKGTNIYSVLADKLEELRKEASASDREETLTGLTKHLHLYPDFHGNRSPLADPRMRGSINGLKLDSSLADLALKFNVTLEAIALQTKHIVDEMNAKGHVVNSIYMSGSQAKNIPLMQLLSNCCSIPIVLPASPSAAVVLGAAMLGRFAAEVSDVWKSKYPGDALFPTQERVDEISMAEKERLWNIMVDMTLPGTRITPSAGPRETKLLEAKYKIFRETVEIQRRWRTEMEEAGNVWP